MQPSNYRNPFSLEGKTIVVTGSSSGIGRQTAIECSRMGARLILVARRQHELEKTLTALDGDGHQVLPADLLMGEKLVQWIKGVSEKFGVLDGIVHAAGVSITMPLQGMTGTLYHKIMSINLDTSYWLLKGFRQKGVHSMSSSVVLLGSVSGTVGTAGLTGYCVSKAGLLGLAQSAALELVKDSVRVNVVSPAHVATEMVDAFFKIIPDSNRLDIMSQHPMGIGRPEDVAYAIIYLLSDASRWVTGINLVVDGGYTAR